MVDNAYFMDLANALVLCLMTHLCYNLGYLQLGSDKFRNAKSVVAIETAFVMEIR